MKPLHFLLLTITAACTAFAADFDRTIFADDFASNAFGPKWGHYKSGSVVKDGLLVGITPEGSDHSAVDNIKFPGERDLQLSVKFRFTSDKAKSFGVWFDDKEYKDSHAGHICQVNVSPTGVMLADAKTGGFDLRGGLYDRKKANQLTPEDKALLATKSKTFPNKLTLSEWHTLVMTTKGDTLTATIDGKEVGTFKSEGVTHATKSLASLTTNTVDIEYDDFSLKGSGPAPVEAKK